MERSRAAVTAVLADGDLGELVEYADRDDAPSLRRVLVDMSGTVAAMNML